MLCTQAIKLTTLIHIPLFLLQSEGNIANLTDVMAEVRSRHKARQREEEPGGATYTIDRRTIDRALQRLQHVLNLVTVVECVNPLSPLGDKTALVILNPVGDEGAQQTDFAAVVADYWRRNALEEQEAAMAVEMESRDTTGSRPKRAKVGRPVTKTPTTAGKRKRRVADDSESSSDSSYSDGSGSSSAESSESEDHDSSALKGKALWRDDSPVRAAARRPRAAQSGGSVTTATPTIAAAAAELIPKELRKSYRNRAIKQKKTFEDPMIFEEVAHPATEAAGWLVAAMRLHFHLAQALLTAGAGSAAAPVSEKATFVLADLLKDLPVGFLLSSGAHLRRQIASRMEQDSGIWPLQVYLHLFF